MRKVYFSWKPRHPVLAWCGFLLILGILALLLHTIMPEGGLTWKLWGFETHSFTIGDEQISLRLDTSGFGRYEVEFQDGTIRVNRDGEAILEGYFISAEACADWMEDALSGCTMVEYDPEAVPASMLYRYETEEEAGYVLLTLIDGSALGAAFDVLDRDTDEAALDCAHRLQFTKRN